MGALEKAIHNSADALHLTPRFSVTPVNDKWVITEQRQGHDDVQYWTNRDTRQDAIDEVMRMLSYGDGEEFGAVMPEPGMDLLERIMAAYDGGETDWCCELRRSPKGSVFHHANCLLDEARRLCGPGE